MISKGQDKLYFINRMDIEKHAKNTRKFSLSSIYSRFNEKLYSALYLVFKIWSIMVFNYFTDTLKKSPFPDKMSVALSMLKTWTTCLSKIAWPSNETLDCLGSRERLDHWTSFFYLKGKYCLVELDTIAKKAISRSFPILDRSAPTSISIETSRIRLTLICWCNLHNSSHMTSLVWHEMVGD